MLTVAEMGGGRGVICFIYQIYINMYENGLGI